jgi:hypothetical protein
MLPLAWDADAIGISRSMIFQGGGGMWKGLQRRFYSALYYFGRTPSTSDEIDEAFKKIEQGPTILLDDPLCDCQVLAGRNTVQCKTRRTSVCEAMGEVRPDVNKVPHKVGFCRNLRESLQ